MLISESCQLLIKPIQKLEMLFCKNTQKEYLNITTLRNIWITVGLCTVLTRFNYKYVYSVFVMSKRWHRDKIATVATLSALNESTIVLVTVFIFLFLSTLLCLTYIFQFHIMIHTKITHRNILDMIDLWFKLKKWCSY